MSDVCGSVGGDWICHFVLSKLPTKKLKKVGDFEVVLKKNARKSESTLAEHVIFCFRVLEPK